MYFAHVHLSRVHVTVYAHLTNPYIHFHILLLIGSK
uniref:Uncharacterized protein n=1 Tax=Setaria italica TaxID=4555 RepID=K3XTR5_SETIT